MYKYITLHPRDTIAWKQGKLYEVELTEQKKDKKINNQLKDNTKQNYMQLVKMKAIR